MVKSKPLKELEVRAKLTYEEAVKEYQTAIETAKQVVGRYTSPVDEHLYTDKMNSKDKKVLDVCRNNLTTISFQDCMKEAIEQDKPINSHVVSERLTAVLTFYTFFKNTKAELVSGPEDPLGYVKKTLGIV